MSNPNICYYQKLHMCEDGKDIYYNVITKKDFLKGNKSNVYDKITWDSRSCFYTEDMISFKDSGIEKELNDIIIIIIIHEKEEQSRKNRVRLRELEEKERKERDEYKIYRRRNGY